MKITALSFLMMLSLLGLTSVSNAQGIKVASVDAQKIFNNWEFSKECTKKFKAASERLERENNERLAVIKQYQEDRNGLHKEHLRKHGSVSPEMKVQLDQKFFALGRDAVALEQDRRDFYAKEQKLLNREFTTKSKLILEIIGEAVRLYAVQEKYDIVIEAGGKTTRELPLFLHLNEVKNITDIVIERLNAETNS